MRSLEARIIHFGHTILNQNLLADCFAMLVKNTHFQTPIWIEGPIGSVELSIVKEGMGLGSSIWIKDRVRSLKLALNVEIELALHLTIRMIRLTGATHNAIHIIRLHVQGTVLVPFRVGAVKKASIGCRLRLDLAVGKLLGQNPRNQGSDLLDGDVDNVRHGVLDWIRLGTFPGKACSGQFYFGRMDLKKEGAYKLQGYIYVYILFRHASWRLRSENELQSQHSYNQSSFQKHALHEGLPYRPP